MLSSTACRSQRRSPHTLTASFTWGQVRHRQLLQHGGAMLLNVARPPCHSLLDEPSTTSGDAIIASTAVIEPLPAPQPTFAAFTAGADSSMVQEAQPTASMLSVISALAAKIPEMGTPAARHSSPGSCAVALRLPLDLRTDPFIRCKLLAHEGPIRHGHASDGPAEGY